MDTDGTITLRDVWLAQNETNKHLGDLSSTIAQVVGRLEGVELRNAQADEMHRAMEIRLRAVEAVHDALDPLRLAGLYDARLRKLETDSHTDSVEHDLVERIGADAVRRSEHRHTAWSTWAFIITAAIALASLVITLVHTHT